jgi:PHP family Zn ribbon phosphoesterase
MKKTPLESSIEKTEESHAALSDSVEILQSEPLATNVAVERIVKGRMKSYIMDLRIHAPVALGYMGIEGIEAAPALIRLAKVKGIDCIAITDFYTGKFVDRVVQAAANSSIKVIPGVTLRAKLSSCDDVVLCALFEEGTGSAQIADLVAALGVDTSAEGNSTVIVPRPFAEIIDEVEKRGGVLFPSRIDKTPHRMSVLNELVETYGFRTFDLAYFESTKHFKKTWPKRKFNLFSFSEAHSLAQIGSRVAKIKLYDLNFAALSALFQRECEGHTAPTIVEQGELLSLSE